MVKRKGNPKITTVKRFNYESFFEDPSAWGFMIFAGFFLLSFLIFLLIPSIKSLYGFSLASIIAFIGLILYSGIKEIVKKRYDSSYMASGFIGLSLLLLIITGMTSEYVSVIVSFISSIVAIVFAIIGIVKSVERKEGSWKIIMDSMVILIASILIWILSVAINLI